MLRGCVVRKEHEVFRDFEFQQYGQLDAGALRNVFSQAMRLSLDLLVLDLDSSSGDAFLSAVHTYRVMRPKTRLIILASCRLPGDKTITDLVAMGIYDIVGGDAIPELQRLLDSPPATYAEAARWTSKFEEGPVPKPNTALTKQWLIKTGYIKGGQLIKTRIRKAEDISADDWQAVIIPAWSPAQIRELSRKIKTKSTIIVVLKGKKKHLSAGADKIARKVTPELIDEAVAASERLRELWRQSESDPLTGAYTRRFFQLWLTEEQRRQTPFTICMMDLDHFKKVNDTYGHDAGDAVLKTFAQFLRDNLRQSDVVCRYGGEEFVIGLPATKQGQAYVLLDRLRQLWQERAVIHGGANIGTTFSAGLAEYSPEIDVIKAADEQLYEAKNKGRNQIRSIRNRVHIMAKGVASIIENLPAQVVSDPLQADIIIADAKTAGLVMDTSTLIVVSETDLGQWALKQRYPGAIVTTYNRLPEVLSEALGISAYVPKIQVLPGARKSDKGTSITRNSAIYIVCPSRPSQAGETTTLLANSIKNVAVICASPASTAAICLGVAKQNLVGCDWRVPNASAPILHNGVCIWPIDPELYQLKFDASTLHVANSIRHKFDLVLVDCAGDLSLCTSAPNSDLVMVIHKEGDTSDYLTQEWLRQYNYRNTCLLSPAEIPQIIAVENGFIFTKGVAHGYERW